MLYRKPYNGLPSPCIEYRASFHALNTSLPGKVRKSLRVHARYTLLTPLPNISIGVCDIESLATPMGGDLAPKLGGTTKFFHGPISGKVTIFRVKISDDLFFSHRLGSSDFPFLFSHFPYVYYVKCRIWLFPHKKTTVFHSVPTFTHIRQHYFSKYWGGPMHGPFPHLKFFGSSPPSPP